MSDLLTLNFTYQYSVLRRPDGNEPVVVTTEQEGEKLGKLKEIFSDVLEKPQVWEKILNQGETPKDLKKRVTKLVFDLYILEIHLFNRNQHRVTPQQVIDFFGSFPNLKNLKLESGPDLFWRVPPRFGPVLDCFSNMPLVKLEIGSKMDLFSCCMDKFPTFFPGLQELSIEFVPLEGLIIFPDPGIKCLHIINALRLMEKAVEATTTIHTVSFICFKQERAKEIMNSKLGDIRLLNAHAEDVNKFYMRIGSVYKKIETSKKKTENQRPLTVHLSWYDTPIDSYKSTCKALYDQDLKRSTVGPEFGEWNMKWLIKIANDGNIPTKEFGLIEALIQAKESLLAVSEETTVSRMFFNLSCEPGIWVNTAIENSKRIFLQSLKALGVPKAVPIEEAMQQVLDVHGNKQSNNPLYSLKVPGVPVEEAMQQLLGIYGKTKSDNPLHSMKALGVRIEEAMEQLLDIHWIKKSNNFLQSLKTFGIPIEDTMQQLLDVYKTKQSNDSLNSLVASGVPIEEAMQKILDVYGNKQSN